MALMEGGDKTISSLKLGENMTVTEELDVTPRPVSDLDYASRTI
jgi:hypothetical protein